jgi:hypothetical protein
MQSRQVNDVAAFGVGVWAQCPKKGGFRDSSVPIMHYKQLFFRYQPIGCHLHGLLTRLAIGSKQ